MKLIRTSKKGLCSIEIGPDGIAIAYSPQPANREITICDFQAYQNGNQFTPDLLKECLTKFVVQYNLKNTQCNWVLHPDFYRLTLIDTPNVPQAEYKQAARWQIKDIISYPIEDATIDILYPDELIKPLKKIYVIAAQQSFLQKIVDVIQSCNLLPIAIDIREFAIRNLITKIVNQNETSGFLSFIKENCLMILIKQSHIQFIRYMPINPSNIKNGNYSDLITEIHRSFSYCQTELSQEASTKEQSLDNCKTELNQELPNKFWMPPQENLDANIMHDIATHLNKELVTFTLKEVVNLKITINQQLESNCWVAVGGALRHAG
ncbi:MAG: hypothetical protein LBL17_05120 [Coxiellaceae bacterium]|jgi:MSHA biogenesis protein MshI|nr:hypothetical protein [Coxiellaceae bacterium]